VKSGQLGISNIFILAVLSAAPAVSQGRVLGHGAARRFVSEKYGFSMAVPVGWGVSTTLNTPVFFYAPSSERFVQDAIPQGGAVITTEPHDTASRLSKSATTPDAWALADARSFASEIPPIEPFLLPSESGAAHAVICSYDEVVFSSDQHIHHSVAIFWEFDHLLFAAHLNYNANDPHGPIFEKVFLQTVRNVRPLQKHSP
jgi:hypothetical protein